MPANKQLRAELLNMKPVADATERLNKLACVIDNINLSRQIIPFGIKSRKINQQFVIQIIHEAHYTIFRGVASFRTRMITTMKLAKTRRIHMRVNLSCANIRMPQHLLYRPNVGTTLQKM